jgi:hypothetical protein
MPSFSNLDDRRGGKSRTVSSIQTISEREMLTWTKPRAAFLGIALVLMLTPVVSGTQQADIDAASAAKAAAGREALTRAPAPVPGLGGTCITFDVPGAVNGTYPASMNPAGAITGNSVDVNFVAHGFLRASNGTFTTFDALGCRPRNVPHACSLESPVRPELIRFDSLRNFNYEQEKPGMADHQRRPISLGGASGPEFAAAFFGPN